MLRFRLSVACLTALLAVAVAADTRDYRAADLRLVGCRLQGGHVVLDRCFDQGTGAGLAMEAEAAVDVVADPPAGQAQVEASGGTCLVRVDRALFPLRVTRPGRYVRWARGFFPAGGGWLHSESLDYGAPQWFNDCDGSTAGRWVWVKGPVYDLAAGMHLLWLHNWHGGALLDKVVLLPEGAPAPEGTGPEAAPLSPAAAGWALAPVLQVPALRSVRAAQWPGEERRGTIIRRLSLDGGRSFALLQTPAAVPAGTVAGVVVRAELERGPDGISPVLATPSLSYETDPRALLVLENAQVRATFLRTNGALVGVYDKAARVECLRAGGLTPPFELRHLAVGAAKPEAVSAEQVKLLSLTVKPDRLQARYVVRGGGAQVPALQDAGGTGGLPPVSGAGLTVTLNVTLQEGRLTWSLELQNRSSLDVVEVACPVLPGWRLGERSGDDLLMTPNWQGGVETSDPVRSGGSDVRYPTGGAMCWLDLYQRRPAHGVYLSGHDRDLLGCVLQATPDQEADTLTFGLTRYARVRPGESYSAAPVVTGLHGGDWHTAADAYRAWARSWMQHPSPPEWVCEADGWYGLVTSADGSRIPFRQMPDYLKQARELGTNYLQVWGQMTGGSNCDSLPYPNPVLGTLDEFKTAVREVRRWGGHITFYVSSQFWKVRYGEEGMLGSTPRALLPPGVPAWDWTEWINYAIRGYDGSFSGDTALDEAGKARYTTPYERTIICPYTDAWANRHLQYWCVDQYGGSYGASGIYLDETCAAGERICLVTGHGHRHHGIWGQSLARDMKALVEGGRKLDPDWTFAMEGCGDAVGQFAHMNLISPASAKKPGTWGATRRFAPECFHYTFPDYILYDGVANGMYGRSQEDCFLDVHLGGNRYDSFSVGPAAAYLKLRQRTKQLLYRARFMDTVGVSSSDEAVRAKVNRLDDAGADVWLANLANPDHKAATVTVTGPPKGAVAYYFDLEGQEGPLALQRADGGVRFTAPTSRASTVLVAGRCEPLVRVPTATLAAGDSGALQVLLTNPLPREVKCSVAVDAPLAGVKVRTLAVALGPQATTTVSLPLAVPATAERRCYNAHLQVQAGAATVRRPLELLVVSPFELKASLAPGGVAVTVTNRSRVAQSGRVTVAGPAGAQAAQALQLAAGAQDTLLLPLAGVLTETATLTATVECGGQTDRQALSVRPLVLNGGFEAVGDSNRPAGWNYQAADLAAVDADHPAEGKLSLRLAGRTGAFLEADQQIPAEEGKHYQVRCRMRRTTGEGARIQPAVVLFLKAGGERYRYLEPLTKPPSPAGRGDGGGQPAEQWTEYATDFEVDADVARVLLYAYNVNSTATAWFDDWRVWEEGK